MSSKPLIVYALRLENDKWYIGKTRDLEKRYQEHETGPGSSWTSLHKPIDIEEKLEDASDFDEDKLTKQYMAKYGINNVRGGSYVQLELNMWQIHNIRREIWTATDRCNICGRSSHFAQDCYAKVNVYGENITQIITNMQNCVVLQK
jgi:predicted GIY-YIG superfamily endonuclease